MTISKISPTSAIQRLREITISQAVVGLLTTKTHRPIFESISPVKWFWSSTIFGIDAGSNNPAIATVGLDQYANMLKDADAELLDQGKRYEKYAAAQAC